MRKGVTRVLAQPFPPTGAQFQVSPDEGRTPAWSRGGRELFYHHQSSNRLMVVKVTTSPGLAFSAPTALPIEDTIHPAALAKLRRDTRRTAGSGRVTCLDR